MSTHRKIFFILGVHAIALAIVYYAWSRDVIGTVVLTFMGAAQLFVFWFLRMQGTTPALGPADRSDAQPGDAAGEPITTYPQGSAWPITVAFGLTVLAAGLAFPVWLLIAGGALTVIGLIGYWAER